MKNFISKLFSRQTSTSLEVTLEKAIREDNVQKAYELLENGANPNAKILYEYETSYDGYDHYTATGTTCPLELARSSEAMKRLLKHYGARPYEELERLWKEQENEAKRAYQREREKKEHEKQQRLEAKALSDNQFLDKVLKN